MRRPIIRWAAILQIGLMLFTGCHPTQPFFVQRDESLANYLAQSVDLEYADVHVDSLPEATEAIVPFGPNNMPSEFVDLTLEDCISMALANSKMIRVVGGTNLQTGSVSAALLSASPGQMPSIYDPAIMQTTSNTQPLTVDSQGVRVAQRGAVRSNQVGGVEDALAEFDAQFSAIMGYNTTDRPRNVGPGNVFNPQFFQAVDGNGQAALSKRHANGTITTARFTTVYSRNNIPAPGLGRNVPSDYTAALEMQINQPLMRGRGTLINRIPLILARINEDIALHEFEINIRNLVQAVEHAYWDLYCGYRAFDSAKSARESALDLWQVANARVGKDGPQSQLQAAGRYHQFDAQTKAALYGSRVPGSDPEGLFGRERRLREYLGHGATDGRMIRPSDEPTVARVHFNWVDVVGEALVRSPELRRQKWAIKQDELELISARNQVLPQLDLVGFYRWLGVGDHLADANRSGISFPSAGSNALEELTGGDYQEVGARVEFTPQAFGKRRAMANIQSSEIQVIKTTEELREKEVMLVSQLSTAWTNIESEFELMYTYQHQWATLKQEVRLYETQLDESFGDTRQLLDQLLRAEELRSRAELQYFQAVCSYNKAIVNLHLLKGSLLDLNSIELQEGAWVDKAYWDAEERSRERAGGIYFDYGYTRPSVVSNGPTFQGGTTEGNISDQDDVGATEYYDDPAVPEEVQAEEVKDAADELQPEISIMDEDPMARSLPGVNRSTNAQVRTASVRQSPAETFEWGEFGMNDGRNRPQLVRPNNRQTISDSSQPTATRSNNQGGVVRQAPSTAPTWNPRF